ncbi:prenyl cysteine carboxyl [Colletotrichum musicola]|uniref:Protein-S-isoprenylcysteine O-methyltransferase n=1 Tax=Colletotrichum musicola TaxID=2175873 RepID=A0A8H6JII4_9PEZI|nr:prenyl cysteine carboxyl [Colletotrichum musicola]
MSWPQTSLAIAYLASTLGTYLAITPPNPTPPPTSSSTPSKPAIKDSIHVINFTHNHINKFVAAPILLISLHAAALAYSYPFIPPSILLHGGENGFNHSLATWSPSTAIPFILLLFLGVPLRLVPFRSLGTNFTFALTRPSGLKTSGIYSYVQHPSYTGIVVVVLCNVWLYARADGVFACWAPPGWFSVMKAVEWPAMLVGAGGFFAGVWMRVVEEERMLRGEFGEKWERWHARTARFVPGVF